MSNNEEVFHKMNINWYPGHMAKTKKQIAEDLKMVDVVIEILDARIPRSSHNPDIAETIKNKKKIVILNKSDLSDEKENRKWVEYFKKQGIPAILVDSNTGTGIKECIKEIEKFMEEEKSKQIEKGRIGGKIKAMVIGIPNVGKSSFINRITKRTTAGVGNKPGVTKQKQWIRVNDKIELLDTPGILWPKFEEQQIALNLAYTGSIKEEVLDRTEIAFYLTKFLIENYKEKIAERYKIGIENIDEIMLQEQDENANIYDIFLEIGKRRGCIKSGGIVDDEKTANIILDEFKNGILGKITIELV